MDSVQRHASPPPRPHSIDFFMQPLRPLLTEETTELCINQPGQVWTEERGGWKCHDVPSLTMDHLMRLVKTASNAAAQAINERNPILSAALPTGERIQIVMPPAVQAGTISITLRKPSNMRFSLGDYASKGFFDHVTVNQASLQPHEKQLMDLLEKRDLESFFRLAVRTRQTIIVSGGTGSGKTTFMKALVDEIPLDERLITIEDTPELDLIQPNRVRLFYSKGGQSAAAVDAKACLEACMRMKPDRILQAEIRDAAALHFINGANSGHPGSITSVHANTPADAFGRIALLMASDESAAGMSRSEIMSLIHATVDIVVQVGKADGLRAATGIYYAPERKYADLG